MATIEVRDGQFVDQIRLTYRDGSVRCYGQSTGKASDAVKLDEDECITEIVYKQGRKNPKAIKFCTNKRMSREWGLGDPNRAWEAIKGSESNPIVDVVSADAGGFCPRIEGGVRLEDVPPAGPRATV